MSRAVALRSDYSADELRKLAVASDDANQARRLLALAAVQDGFSRSEAARLNAMDGQTLRDWVLAFNEHGPQGLFNTRPPGRPPKLTPEQKAYLEGFYYKPRIDKELLARHSKGLIAMSAGPQAIAASQMLTSTLAGVVNGLVAATGMPMINAVGSSLVAVTAFGLTTAANYALSGLVDWALAGVFIVGDGSNPTSPGTTSLRKRVLSSVMK